MRNILLFMCLVIGSFSVSYSQSFTAGNIVVYRVGDGSASLSNAATACFLDEYTPSGTFVRSIALPTAASGANAALTNSGTATSEGALTLSPNKYFLSFAGYDAVPGTSSISGTTSSSVNRVVGFTTSAGVVNTSTRLTDAYSGNNIRGAITDNGARFWTSGPSTGTRYTTLGATTSTQISTTLTNTRIVNIFNDQLYTSSASGSFHGISAVGSGLPTLSGQVVTILPGFSTTAGPSAYGFVGFDLNPNVSGIDVIYVADDRTSASNGGIQRWNFDGTTWALAYTLNPGATTGIRGLTGELQGNDPVLYGTTTANAIIKITDTGATSAFTTLVAASPTNTAFRGLSFAPEAFPTVSLSVSSNSGTEAASSIITVTATASKAVSGNQSVDVAVSGTGIDGGDYSLSSTTITIPDGQTSGSVTFTITDDTAQECAETATLTINNPTAFVVLGSTLSQNIAITDNDVTIPTANLTISAVTGSEASSTVITLTATASAAVLGNQSVNIGVTGAGIAAGDYALSNSSISILSGQTTGTATFTVINDSDLEGSETARMSISSPSSCLSLGANTFRDVFIFDNDFPAAPAPNNEIQLSLVSSYLNVGPNPGNSAEISAYDPISKRLFIVNSLGRKLNIVDFSNPAAMSNIATIDIAPFGGINSVAVRNGIVAVAIETTNLTGSGSVLFFDKDGALLKQVTVGSMPDMITFSPNGNFVLTADEGEPNDAYDIDPEGTVSIIDISGGIANLTQANVTKVNFNSYDAQLAAFRTQGIRIYGPNATVSKDFEPEYIAFSADGNTAYVTLQENNAIAVLDMATKTFTAIRPLGLKDHNLLKNGLDASDNPGGLANVNITNLPVKGMYQPDAIAGFSVGGINYLVTANEGDSRVYPRAGSPVGAEGSIFTEEVRVGAAAYVLDPAKFPDATLLKNNSVLGRLQLTNKTGDTDGDGDFDEIHALGARSFSIWKPTATGLEQVFDSGDQFERITLANATFGSIFNASHDNVTPKNRSDNKGPEPEGVSVATLNGKVYAFIALERIGGVMTYNITDPVNPVFVQWANTRSTTTAGVGDLGSEGIFFIKAEDSPTGVPLVVVSNEVSSTISVYSVGGGTAPFGPMALAASSPVGALPVTLTWSHNSADETGFQIQRSLTENSGFAAIGSVSENVLTFTDNTVVANTTYFYRVVAFNDFAVSGFSAVSIATKQNQTITFTPVDKTLGDPAFALSATATSGLAVTSFTTTSDKIVISGSQVTLVKAGRASVTANQAGNNTFLPAPLVERSFCIKPAKPSVTVSNINTEAPLLTSNATAGNQWFVNGTAIAGATSATLNASAAGVYKVNVKVDDCTSDFSADVTLIVTGDLPTNSPSISAYPNPVEDYLQIQGISDIQESRLMDIAGKERKITLEKNLDGYRANVQDLPSGMYVLRLNGATGLYKLKFVKK